MTTQCVHALSSSPTLSATSYDILKACAIQSIYFSFPNVALWIVLYVYPLPVLCSRFSLQPSVHSNDEQCTNLVWTVVSENVVYVR